MRWQVLHHSSAGTSPDSVRIVKPVCMQVLMLVAAGAGAASRAGTGAAVGCFCLCLAGDSRDAGHSGHRHLSAAGDRSWSATFGSLLVVAHHADGSISHCTKYGGGAVRVGAVASTRNMPAIKTLSCAGTRLQSVCQALAGCSHGCVQPAGAGTWCLAEACSGHSVILHASAASAMKSYWWS